MEKFDQDTRTFSLAILVSKQHKHTHHIKNKQTSKTSNVNRFKKYSLAKHMKCNVYYNVMTAAIENIKRKYNTFLNLE